MQLTPEQLNQLKSWAAAGQSLSGIQKRLESEFGLRMTYMDLRFLLDDYAIDLSSAPAAPVAKDPAPEAAGIPADAEPLDGANDLPGNDGTDTAVPSGVTVEVDRINRPGAVMSGDVTFSDGVKAKWYVNAMGQLGLDGVDKNYRPTPADVQDFQIELQKIFQKKGY
jgi:hypothetical protein